MSADFLSSVNETRQYVRFSCEKKRYLRTSYRSELLLLHFAKEESVRNILGSKNFNIDLISMKIPYDTLAVRFRQY